ncbi:hypothetical protein FLX27_18780 [Agrobacterium tumefaciens]|nr:hypothetical protein FLX27_18780 [Agrobacterium tumefaciens]
MAGVYSEPDHDMAYDEAEASEPWRDLPAPTTILYPWDDCSTYIRRPPFAGFGNGTKLGNYEATPILVVGDDITTDHISPAGAISAQSEAGRHLAERGDDPTDLNVFSSRRGNWEVMIRGLFTNKSVRNLLGASIPPGSTVLAGSGETLPLWDAAQKYRAEGRSVVVIAGERYGMGSSRDWAAKGVAQLGARAVLAVSFEHIHRWNLIGMGVLPLRLPHGMGPESLGLGVDDLVCINADLRSISPRGAVEVTILRPGGESMRLKATAAVEASAEIRLLVAGGVLPLILNDLKQSLSERAAV